MTSLWRSVQGTSLSLHTPCFHMNYLLNMRPEMRGYRGEAVTFCERKLDGHRCTIHKMSSGVIAVGRKEDIDLWPKLSLSAKIVEIIDALPADTILDGEIYVEGTHATSIKTAINDGEAGFSIFAVPKFAGEDWRQKPYLEVKSFFPCEFFQLNDGVVYLNNDDVEYLLEEARKKQYEGWVLKNAHYDEWYKLKPNKSVDAVVVGVKGGNGKYIGLLGAITVAVFDNGVSKVIASVGSGFQDSDRIPLRETEQLMFRVAEVEYDSIAAQGRLRFPRFVRWRDDKPATECTIDQLS